MQIDPVINACKCSTKKLHLVELQYISWEQQDFKCMTYLTPKHFDAKLAISDLDLDLLQWNGQTAAKFATYKHYRYCALS